MNDETLKAYMKPGEARMLLDYICDADYQRKAISLIPSPMIAELTIEHVLELATVAKGKDE